VKLYLALALLFPAFTRADSVYLDESFPETVRPTLQNLADTIWDIVEEMYHGNPPLDLPIYVHHSDADAPLTTVDNPGNPTQIRIRIVSGGTYYAQFAFELGHELGHVMLDPRRANGIVEAICDATSYEVLDQLGDRVENAPAYSWLTDYAPHFREYLHNDEDTTLAGFPADVRDMVRQNRWSDLAAYLHQHLSVVDPYQPHERTLQSLAAIALRAEPVDWGGFTGLAACTNPTPDQDPRFKILPITPDCVDRVSDVLRRIGVESSSSSGND
jgi:hypothetical protein